MSEIYGYRAQFDSGGISGPSSTIKVTFPSGATNVTLIGGGKTWRPIQQDSTSAVYQVKWTGTSITYTASATSGGNTKSVSVTISYAYEFVEVQISFIPQWYESLKTQSVGQTLSVDGYDWLIVNKTSSAAVLGLSIIYSMTVFGSNSTYAGSTLASVAIDFESQNLSTETKAVLNNVTVNNVTAKVFIPSKEQCSGGFSHYNSDANRLCQYQGSTNAWWTSSADGSMVKFVNVLGQLGIFSPSSTDYGFRPHIEVNLTL